MNIQDWFPLGLTVLISLQSKGLSRVQQYHSSKISIIWHSALFVIQLSHPYMTTGKTIALIIQTIVYKVLSLLFNTLSRLVIDILPRSKRLLISWLQSPSAVILESNKMKFDTVSTFFPIYLPWNDGIRCHDLSFFECWVFCFCFCFYCNIPFIVVVQN